MGTYDVGARVDPSGEGAASIDPHWVLCVVRFKHLVTYSRATKSSRSLDGTEVAAEAGDPLVIASDCTSVVVRSTKGSHVSNLVATILPGKTNYLSGIMPGDWLLSWMTHSAAAAQDIVRRIKSRQACNGFLDGLKFVGRVYSLRKDFGVNPETGVRRTSYALQGSGFAEFDTAVHWDPYLVQAETLINTWLGKLSVAVNDFLSEDGIDVNKAIPTLVELLFGRGVSKRAANPDGAPQLQGVTGLTEGEGDAPFAYVVPTTVGDILGRRSRSKSSGVLAYADLLSALYGVQKYESSASADSWAAFQPSALKPMLGRFLPAIPQFTGKAVWSILAQYVNPVVNEMYTALRADQGGSVLPTLVVRQLPFTTSEAASSTRTSFLELPRWRIPDSLVYGGNLGRSDALRFNFVHLLGQPLAQTQTNIYTYQLVRSPPIRDDQDIRRSGLRPDIQATACGVEDAQRGPQQWMDLRAEMLMGQHLTLTGTLRCVGVLEPICHGDNLEYDGCVLQIESVTHTCSISPDGRRRQFITELALSHGVRADPASVAGGDSAFFTGTRPEDLTGADAGLTLEGADPSPRLSPGGSDSGALGDFFAGLSDLG